MRSTSIFLLITSVLTFSFSAFSASAEDAAMHHHTMSSMADMPGMKKPDDSATFIQPAGSLKPGATMPS
jgi:Cu(I)/Ag(I) efflux system protein CusF